MFWTTGRAAKDVDFVRSFGLQAGQLGVPGELPLEGLAGEWRSALGANPDFAIVTAVCSYAGEDYTDVQSVRETVGFLPPRSRASRLQRTHEVAVLAASLGISSIAAHIGFVPEDRSCVTYAELRNDTRELCDSLAQAGQTFALETGQETAEALLAFIRDVERPNLKINFDPANLILYGTGDPVEAVRVLGPNVVSVHCKDARPPANPGALGAEVALGHGQVDFPAFYSTLRESGYTGILSIEREEQDQAKRTADIHHAVRFLRSLLAA